jgi:DNA polymerase III delta prime subunit
MADKDQQNTQHSPSYDQRDQQVDTQYNIAGDLRQEYNILTSYDRRERRRVLKQVRENWVVGVLDKSLYQEALILLEMETDPEAVDPPCINYTGLKLGAKHKNTARIFPPETTVVQVFDESDYRLLILGNPGSGKTTLLLDLARTLLNRAEQDNQHPIPIVLNLSSWASQRLAFDQWLVQELRDQYGVGKKLAQQWVKQRTILPLLDGLDELANQHRSACISAINAFYRDGQGTEGIVVCSRKNEFHRARKKFVFDTAVELKPLTDTQIANYLQRTGSALTGIREVLSQDTDLRDLARMPLMLNIMALTYENQTPEELIGRKPQEQRQRLFASYVQRMFQRDHDGRTDRQAYNPGQTVKYLSWLAQKMANRDQTVFFLEDLSPVWLDTKIEHRQIRFLFVLLIGLVYVLLGGLYHSLLDGPWVLKIIWTIVYGIGGIAVGLMLSSSKKAFKIGEQLRWSWRKFISRPWFVLLLGGAGFLVGFRVNIIIDDPAFAQRLGIVAMLWAGLSAGFTSTEKPTREIPNEGFWFSLRSAAVFTFNGWFLGGLIFVLTTVEARLGIATGLFLIGGGAAVMQHISVRLTLAQKKYIPWNYVHFLNYAVERILLRRVGGGYIFIHRMFLDYFAKLTPEQQQTLVERVNAPIKEDKK